MCVCSCNVQIIAHGIIERRRMKKWNFKKSEYEPYAVPRDWVTPLIEHDLDKIVNCASCGEKVAFGDGYRSRKIHTDHGLGYTVCQKCYEKEWAEEMEHIWHEV